VALSRMGTATEMLRSTDPVTDTSAHEGERQVTFPAVAVEAPGRAGKADYWSLLVLWLPIIGNTWVSKIAYEIGGREILIGVPAILIATAIGAFTGRLQVEAWRFMMYLGVCAILVAEQAFAVFSFSGTSLALLLTLHLPYVFQLRGLTDEHRAEQMARFVNLTFIICILGIVQYFAQFVIGARYAYPIEHFTPHSFITHGYNYLNVLRYGSTTYKSNGLVLLEPSYYSQLLAIGFGLEAASRRRIWRLAVYAMGFGVSFSGTGLIMMAFVLPTLMIAYRRYSLLLLLIIGGFTAVLFGESLGLGLFLERSREFESTDSSGYQRYIGPALLFGQYLWGEPRRWLFGLGAGMMTRMTPKPMFNAAETGWAKLILEFGLVGSGAYFFFLYANVFRSRQPAVLRVSLAVMTLLSGILDSPVHGMIIPLLVWLAPSPSDRSQDDAGLTAPRPEMPSRRLEAEYQAEAALGSRLTP
jgi:hypothetical protein